MERYSCYIDEMRKLGEFPLWKNVKIDDLNPSRGAVQRAYKEIKEEKFEGSLIDYICWVSMLIIVFFSCQGINKNSKLTGSVKRRIRQSMSVFSNMFPVYIKNALRLYLKSRDYLDKTIEIGCSNMTEDTKMFLSDELNRIFEKITPKDI